MRIEQETLENILEFIVTFIGLFVIGTIMYLLFTLFVDTKFTWKSYLLFDSMFSILGTLYVYLSTLTDE